MKLSLGHKKESHGSGPAVKGTLHNIGRDPYIDWTIIFWTTIILLLGLIVWGYLTFMNAESRLGANSSAALTSHPSFDTKQLSSLLSNLQDRTSERSQLLKTYGGPGDPSL